MRIVAEPLTAQAFKPFGTVVERHEHSQGTWHHPLTVLDGPATFAVLMWRHGTAGDEECVPVTTPLTVVLP
jgi:ureidoglycolate hydrolase